MLSLSTGNPIYLYRGRIQHRPMFLINSSVPIFINNLYQENIQEVNLGERYIFDWRGIAVTDFEGSHCSTTVIIVDYLPLGRLGNYVINDITFTQVVILSSVTIYHGISLNMKGQNLRKFIAGTSMINVGMLLIIVTNYDFTLTYIFLSFYLLFYNLTCIGYFGVLLRQNSKCGTLVYNDVPVIQLPALKLI